MPNQQQDDFVPWLIKNFGKKFYRSAPTTSIRRKRTTTAEPAQKYGGEVVGEEYVPLGHSEFSSVINKFRQHSRT